MSKKFYTKLDKTLRKYNILVLRCKRNRIYQGDVDGKKFSMFTKGQNAWLENPAEEAAVVAAMKAGAKMSVAAASRRGTQTSYNYSLSGVTASISDISSCK